MSRTTMALLAVVVPALIYIWVSGIQVEVDCEHKGGTLVRSRSGYACIKAEVIK